MLSEWLSWTWDRYANNREDIVPLLTLVGGSIGIVFLGIRTRAADRTARAALQQSVAAAEQAKVATTQAMVAADRHQEQIRSDRERRITESFAVAVEQLSSDKLETRLGSIYTLERIAMESEREYWPIIEMLTAFVRHRAPWPPHDGVHNPFVELQTQRENKTSNPIVPARSERDKRFTAREIRPAIDIQAVLSVLGRRDRMTHKSDQGRQVNLSRTDLRGADLKGVNLKCADLRYANLNGAALSKAHLEGAELMNAKLEYADLSDTHLEGAGIWGVSLNGANLLGAHLEDVDCTLTVDLKSEQLRLTYANAETSLPEDVIRPERWPAKASEGQP